jgi:hypothetical protein
MASPPGTPLGFSKYLQRFYIQTITYQIFALMVRQAHHERKYLIFITVRAELVEAH